MLAHKAKAAAFVRERPLTVVSGLAALGALVAAAVLAWTMLFPRERVDLSASLPADALVYLETRDLGAALRAVTASPAFRDAASRTPDLSVLEGMQVAVAVTGFDIGESRLNEEVSEADFRPRFVAVAETGLWNWQARAFAERSLGDFVTRSYGGTVEAETDERDSGTRFVWKAPDGRRSFAFVRGGRIYFGNDEAAVDRCLAVERGEFAGLSTDETLRSARASAEDALALGYVSPNGVAQLSNVAGLTAALSMAENEVARSFIARTLPEMVRSSVREVVWTARSDGEGMVDDFDFVLVPQASRALAAAAQTGTGEVSELDSYVSSNVFSVTRYDMTEPDVAWKTAVEVAASSVDELSGRLLEVFSGSLLVPFGVTSPQDFLRAVRGRVLTAHFDADGEESFAVARFREAAEVKRSLGAMDFKKAPEKYLDAEIWLSEDGDLAAAFVGDVVMVGAPDAVRGSLSDRNDGQTVARKEAGGPFYGVRAATVTLGREVDTAERVVEALAGKKDANMRIATRFQTETYFSDRGMTRRTTSPFGFFGRIVAQFAAR
jgi:hypothetical protein